MKDESRPLRQIAYDLATAGEAVCLSITSLRAEIREGRLKAKKYGREYRVGAIELRAWFERLPDAD